MCMCMFVCVGGGGGIITAKKFGGVPTHLNPLAHRMAKTLWSLAILRQCEGKLVEKIT